MAGRSVTVKVLDSCFNPLTIFKNGRKYVVPCGYCSACLLQKANSWSHRVSDEITFCPAPIFFTLTYNNYYLPKLHISVADTGLYRFSSQHPLNLRFDGSSDVVRDDDITLFSSVYPRWSVENYFQGYIGYSSKRDFQLWIKLLRKDVSDLFGKTFRYYAVSEYGPSTYRPHIHGILFCPDTEVGDFLIKESMYKNWKMCDKSLFDKYTHYCDSGASNYVSSYIARFANLPSIYSDKQVSPFRLASKAPAIGFSQFNENEVQEAIIDGTIRYTKPITDVNRVSELRFPKSYLARLFPKLQRYGLLSYDILLQKYGILYNQVCRKGFSYDVVSSRLRSYLPASDWYAIKKCYDVCLKNSWTPETYFLVVDKCYYLLEMDNLRHWYTWQENNHFNKVSIAFSYTNFVEYVKSPLDSSRFLTIELFCNSLGFDIYDLRSKSLSSLVSDKTEYFSYKRDVEYIVDGLQKLPKLNEKLGTAPHIV